MQERNSKKKKKLKETNKINKIAIYSSTVVLEFIDVLCSGT